MPSDKLVLVSHPLCPYVQRAAISLTEKGIEFERRDIDLSNKPTWFLKASPTGKTPLIIVKDVSIFESNVILEYLEETQPNPLHPRAPLERALHRSWIEFSSTILNHIAGLYSAATQERYSATSATLSQCFHKIEETLGDGPFFSGKSFSLVDASFAPLFRYFDVFEQFVDLDTFRDLPKCQAWRRHLAERPSVGKVVSENYSADLIKFLRNKDSVLGALALKA